MPVETQQTIGEWNVATFGPSDDPKPQALRLLAEVVELCYASGSSRHEIAQQVGLVGAKSTLSLYDHRPEPDKIPGELADVQIVASSMAHRLGIDLADATNAKMAINRSRTWDVKGDGTGQHV